MAGTNRKAAFEAVFAKLQSSVSDAVFAHRTYRPDTRRNVKKALFPKGTTNRTVWLYAGGEGIRLGEKGASDTAPKRWRTSDGQVLFWVRRTSAQSDDDLAGLLADLKVEVEAALEAVEVDQFDTADSWTINPESFETFEGDPSNQPPFAGGFVAFSVTDYR